MIPSQCTPQRGRLVAAPFAQDLGPFPQGDTGLSLQVHYTPFHGIGEPWMYNSQLATRNSHLPFHASALPRVSAGAGAGETTEKLSCDERTGRPLGSDTLVAALERRLGCILRPQKPGRKPTAHPK